ncbi:hypothetical protein ECE50_022740 [Chitinophaga sp. Mgbs1]|uniref:Uncharacterized protein n=1 Tax=Chitinophaga solisilvae TaxID=1233460 RepID=A0A9Q5GSH1_9BACT|nr:hypothetical protein [Chitinophaga solisilvae]
MDSPDILMTDPMAIARSMKLRYVKAGTPGYARLRQGKDFTYTMCRATSY